MRIKQKLKRLLGYEYPTLANGGTVYGSSTTTDALMA